MKVTLVDNALRRTHNFTAVDVNDAIGQMCKRCMLSWEEQAEPHAMLNHLNVARMDGAEVTVSAYAVYEGNEQRYFMMVRP